MNNRGKFEVDYKVICRNWDNLISFVDETLEEMEKHGCEVEKPYAEYFIVQSNNIFRRGHFAIYWPAAGFGFWRYEDRAMKKFVVEKFLYQDLKWRTILRGEELYPSGYRFVTFPAIAKAIADATRYCEKNKNCRPCVILNPDGTLEGYGLERPCETNSWIILKNSFLTETEIAESSNLERTILEKLLRLEFIEGDENNPITNVIGITSSDLSYRLSLAEYFEDEPVPML
jgi:hypothetical protein